MRNEVIRLVTTDRGRGSRGFMETKETQSREIFASENTVGIIEKYEAQKEGSDISLTLEIDTLDYEEAYGVNGRPDSVDYRGRRYLIYDLRKKKNDPRTIEIVCRR